jgi:tRNA1Val (adenine37-N6)-methyltransferase
MSNDYFRFKQFTIRQDKTAMKVGIDSVMLGAWTTIDGSEKNVLDIGAGTGLLAMMIAQRNPTTKIFAVEIDEQASQQAAENIAASDWNDRITVVNTDIRTFALNPDDFDLIICNPPYFEKSLKSHNSQRNYARHNDSLSFADLIDCVHRLLCRSGRFALIIPEDKANTIIELADRKRLFPVRRLNVRPTETKPVTRVILEFSYISHRVFYNEGAEDLQVIPESNYLPYSSDERILTVRTDDCYSNEYKSLTRDFYL